MINKRNPRQAYGETLLQLGKENPNIVACDADLSKSTMSCLFGEAFPDRFFEMGIAEANMTSFAAGLSLAGKIPFTHSFAVFSAGRSYDQIRQGICIGSLNVKIVGSASGLSDFGDGSTHQAVEDLAIMRAIPNLTVLCPADCIEVERMTRAAAVYNGPVYLRICRNDMPDITARQEDKIGISHLLRPGTDAVVYACGIMVFKALTAAESLQSRGISLRVVNVSTLKPVDETQLRRFAEGMRAVVTAEEHSIIGGLASVVSYALRGSGAPLAAVAIEDRFGQSAHSYEELLDLYGLTTERIVAEVEKQLDR